MINVFAAILENVLIMVLTIVVLAGGCYLMLLALNLWLKIKSGSREQEGLSNMLVSAMKEAKERDTAENDPSVE